MVRATANDQNDWQNGWPPQFCVSPSFAIHGLEGIQRFPLLLQIVLLYKSIQFLFRKRFSCVKNLE